MTARRMCWYVSPSSTLSAQLTYRLRMEEESWSDGSVSGGVGSGPRWLGIDGMEAGRPLDGRYCDISPPYHFPF